MSLYPITCYFVYPPAATCVIVFKTTHNVVVTHTGIHVHDVHISLHPETTLATVFIERILHMLCTI